MRLAYTIRGYANHSIRQFCQEQQRLTYCALTVGMLFVVTPSAFATPYLLQSGDRIRIDVDGVPRAEVVTTINAQGMIDHSRFGAIAAAGISIAELRLRIADHIANTTIAFFNEEGERLNLLVEKADVRVDIEAVKPVIVAGLVRNPGGIAWTPGLTARRAIAMAGGFDTPVGASADVPRLRTALDRLLVERAAVHLALWRVDALSRGAGDVSPPEIDPAVARLDADAAQRIVEVAKDQLRIVSDERWIARSILRDRIAMLGRQRKPLLGLVENYKESLAADEREFEEVRNLFDRGLASRDRLSDMRRATVLSSTRLLEARAKEASLAIEIQTAEQALETLEINEAEEDASARIAALTSLLDISARLISAKAAFDMVVGGGADLNGSALTLQVKSAQGTNVSATLDTTLSPGDLVEVVTGIKR